MLVMVVDNDAGGFGGGVVVEGKDAGGGLV